MASRNRSRPNTYYVGTGYRGTSISTRQGPLTWNETCADVVGSPGIDHDFLRVKGESNAPALNGSNGQVGLFLRSYSNYAPSLAYPGYGSAPAYNVSELVTSLLAKANPATAKVQLPVFVFELRELPRLILLAGRSIAGKFASANLAWQFGWKPLIGDLERLFNFQDAVNSRVKDLERLASGGGLRKRKTLRTWSNTTKTSNVCIESLMSFIYAKKVSMSTQKIWGTVRWFSDPSQLPQTDEDRVKLARRLVLGLTFGQQLSNLWEALPWSWLIDWCVNVQDFIEASNNSLTVSNPRVNIMVNSKTIDAYVITQKPSWVTMDPSLATMTIESKRRIATIGSPSFHVSLPFLTEGQLSILGSLAILKSRRG